MSNTDWNNVAVPDQKPEPEPSSGIAGTLGFIVFILLLLLGGGVFLNWFVFATRIKDRAIDECDGPSCVLEVKAEHDRCINENLVWGPPSSFADFQTPPEADNLGVLSVQYAPYKQCVGFGKPKTLSEREAAGQ